MTAYRVPSCIVATAIGDTVLETWFERDRAHVCLSRKDRDGEAGDTIVEWWDENVAQAVEDGFLDPRDFHASAFEHAVRHGMIKKLDVDLSPIWPSAAVSFVRNTPSRERPVLQPERLEWYADGAAETAESILKDRYFSGLSPDQADKVSDILTAGLYEAAVLAESGPQPLRIETRFGQIAVEIDGDKMTARGGRIATGTDYVLAEDRKGAFVLSWRYGEDPASGEVLASFSGSTRGLRVSVLNALAKASDGLRDLRLAELEYRAFDALNRILAASGELGPGSGTVRQYQKAYDAARIARAAVMLKTMEPEREPVAAPAPAM